MSPAPDGTYDIFIIGGGINGAGIARDAAGRHLKVGLCERGDLAGATSSLSSKLIHGGLRYLEHYQFGLVREALAERDILLRNAPHLVRPLRFVLPHVPSMRPVWKMRAGLFLYDHLHRTERLPRSETLDLHDAGLATELKPEYRRAFAYSDCYVDDARLVILNARAAANLGADVRVRTACTGAERGRDLWQIALADEQTGELTSVRARALIDAAGPWALEVLGSIRDVVPKKALRLVQGSHIVVTRAQPEEYAYALQNDDKRVVFIIPFEGEYSLIGTTELEIKGAPGPARTSAQEVGYLCRAVGRYLSMPPRPEDVVWSYAGVRPLLDDGHADPSALTRDYSLDLDATTGKAPLLTVYGGKITTNRRLAERALARLQPFLPQMGAAWTESAALPGGDIPQADFDRFLRALSQSYPRLPQELLRSLARRHGTLTREVLATACTLDGLGEDFGAGLYAREVDYFMDQEWARTAEDVLWRRTKAGLRMAEPNQYRLSRYMAQRLGHDDRRPGFHLNVEANREW